MENLMVIIGILVLTIGCNEKNDLTVKDIEIFYGTPAEKLAIYLEEKEFEEANHLIKEDNSLLNFKDPLFGTTLLMRAVSNENYEAAKWLLKNGADPNIKSNTGSTALFRAVSFSWVDDDANESSKYVDLLLAFNADPNIPYCSEGSTNSIDPVECGTTPLIHASSRSLSKTKSLVESGADINSKTVTGKTAAVRALMMKEVDIAYYLIVINKASVTDPYYFYEIGKDSIDYDKKHYPVTLLRKWIFDINTKKYDLKMAIVNEFANQGINYWETEIPDNIRDQIENLYPGKTDEFLKKY